MPLTTQGRRTLSSFANRNRNAGVDRWLGKAKGKAYAGREAAPARRLAYYASTLPDKENWHQTPEGYRIYTNVPICRTGSQTYIGREIKKNVGYRPEWAIGDNDLVEVFRPLEEVTARATLASFEGKSVLDEHPAGDKILIDALDEYEGYSKGHATNIRVGAPLSEGEFAGETPLIADLWVKHPDLNVKIDTGIRDVSCGYTFTLGREDGGRYVMREIRGNHHAVVPKGRAGPEIGIRDSAPPSTTTAPITQRGAPMSFLKTVFGIGLQNLPKDSKPEDLGGALMDEFRAENGASDAAPDPKEFTAAVNAAVDAKLKEISAAKDAEEAKKKEDEEAAKDAEKECESMADEDMAEEEAAADDAVLIPALSESLFSVGDAAKLLGALRPVVARSKNKGALDAYNKLAKSVKSLRSGVKDGAPDPFAALIKPSNSAVADAEPETPMFMFFNGKSYEQGLKDWNEYQKSKGAR